LELLKLEPSPQVVSRAKATRERQVADLTRLVDDLLDVSRITRGKIALKRTAIDARQRVSDAVSAAEPVRAGRISAWNCSCPNIL